MLDKKFMLLETEYAEQLLTLKYRSMFVTNPEISYNYQTSRRSQIRKELGLCKLVRELLEQVPDDFELREEMACDAFKRITDPRIRSK